MANNGLLKIESKDDRVLVASILYKNGYTVRPVRKKKNGKSYDYLIQYEMKGVDAEETTE